MQSIINNKTKLKLLIGFGLAFALVVLVQFLSSRSINDIIRNEKAVIIHSKTIEQANALKSSISAFESKIRGFVLTGNRKFLEGNETAQLTSLKAIENLMADSESAVSSELTQRLNELVARKINFTYSLLIAYNKSDNKAAVNLINTGQGKYLMDSIVDACDKIILQQKQQLLVFSKNNETNTTFALNADLISGIIILISIIVALLILFKDINDRIKLENILREEQKKVEKSMAIKEQFIANMSHEIRTPLNAMLGFSDLLENTELSAQQKDHLAAITVAGKNLLTLINDILDFSKIEAGMLDIEKVPFSPKELLQSAYTLFFPKAQSKNLKLYLSIDPKLPELVNGDPTRLNQIVMNLIGNAIKFTREGNIQVSCELQEINGDHVKIKIAIKDTGIGIANDKLDYIFDRFTQADNATTRNFGGTGLGLSIAKKLIELQGGYIAVSSLPGKGSEFYFSITYTIADNQEYLPTVEKKKTLTNSAGKKILIVEDNPLNQKLAELLLHQHSLQTTTCANGQLALEALQKQDYDLILMDLQMPLMDGYETTQIIRKKLGLTIPIIAMTANAMSGEYEKCLTSGMNDYISKPFKADILFETIDTLLSQKVQHTSI